MRCRVAARAGDSSQIERLRTRLLSGLCERDVVPDQNGVLCSIPSVNYPPRELTSDGALGTKILEQWAQYSGRPSNWLHRRAVPPHTTRSRRTIDRAVEVGKRISVPSAERLRTAVAGGACDGKDRG